MILGLVTPYDRSETTWAALRLADLALSCGHDVRLIAPLPARQGIHPFWDRAVYTSRERGLWVAGQRCDRFIHFHQPNASVISDLTLVAEKAKHDLVFCWHQFRQEQIRMLRHYDRVLTPGADIGKVYSKMYKNHGVRASSVKKPQVVHWDAGVPPVMRQDYVCDGEVNACFLLNHTIIDHDADKVLDVVEDLLASMRFLRIRLVSTKTWPNQPRRRLLRMLKANPERLYDKRLYNFTELNQSLHESDWAIVLSLRADFGIMVERALACGCAVASIHLPPLQRSLDCGVYSIHADVRYNWLRAPVALFDPGELLRVCRFCFSSRELMFKLQSSAYQSVSEFDAFQKFWESHLQG